MNSNYTTSYNYSNYPQNRVMPNYNQTSINQSQNDERLIGGGFLGPFILGGITGGLVSPFFYGGYNNRPPVYYYQPGPYRPPMYGPSYGPRPY